MRTECIATEIYRIKVWHLRYIFTLSFYLILLQIFWVIMLEYSTEFVHSFLSDLSWKEFFLFCIFNLTHNEEVAHIYLGNYWSKPIRKELSTDSILILIMFFNTSSQKKPISTQGTQLNCKNPYKSLALFELACT